MGVYAKVTSGISFEKTKINKDILSYVTQMVLSFHCHKENTRSSLFTSLYYYIAKKNFQCLF